MNVYYMDIKIDRAVTGGQIHLLEVMEYLSRNGDDIFYSRSGQQKNVIVTNMEYVKRYILSKNIDEAVFLEDYSQRFYLFIFNIVMSLIRKRRVVTIVNALYFSYRTSVFKNCIDKFVSKLFLKYSDVVIAGGESAKREVMSMGIPAEKIRVVYPALRPTFASNSIEKNNMRKDHFELLFVARLNPIKGLEYLLEALALLENKDICLKVVGNETAVPDYTRKIKDIVLNRNLGERVSFVGEISDTSQLLGIYRKADIFVLPSLWDTSPVALLEAMCVGLPIVATEVGGIPEWVENNVNGILVSPRNPENLATAIQMLIDTPDLLETMGRNSLRKSKQFRERTWTDVAREYREIIHGADEGHRA